MRPEKGAAYGRTERDTSIPDSVITTQRDGQTIVAELFFNHSGTETFRDKLLKVILADSLQDGQEPEKTKITR